MQYIPVPKSDHTIALRHQPSRPVLVRLQPSLSVLAAIGLDDQPMVQAYEIRNVRADRVLTPELATAKPTATDQKPEETLGVGHLATKLASADGLHGGKVNGRS